MRLRGPAGSLVSLALLAATTSAWAAGSPASNQGIEVACQVQKVVTVEIWQERATTHEVLVTRQLDEREELYTAALRALCTRHGHWRRARVGGIRLEALASSELLQATSSEIGFGDFSVEAMEPWSGHAPDHSSRRTGPVRLARVCGAVGRAGELGIR